VQLGCIIGNFAIVCENHPGAPRHPSTGGEFTDVLQPNSPPVEGCRPQAAGWFTPIAQVENLRKTAEFSDTV